MDDFEIAELLNALVETPVMYLTLAEGEACPGSHTLSTTAFE
jgi:hypothetical protein